MPPDVPLDAVIAFLLDTPMFEHLNEDELSLMVHILELRRFDKGEVIFRAGDPGHAWFVVYSGAVEISHFGVSGTRVLNSLGPHGCFGEMAILDGSARSAKVRGIAPGILLQVPTKAFNRLLRQDNLAAYKLVHRMALLLAARIRSMNAESAMGELADLTDADDFSDDPTDH